MLEYSVERLYIKKFYQTSVDAAQKKDEYKFCRCSQKKKLNINSVYAAKKKVEYRRTKFL